jgi:hypothetical protein
MIMLAASACSAPNPNVNFCDLPPNLRSWENSSLRLQGYVVGEWHHGFGISAEGCLGFATLDYDKDSAVGRQLTKILETEYSSGILRLDVTGRITREEGAIGSFNMPEGPVFKVIRLHNASVENMSLKDQDLFFKRDMAKKRAWAAARRSGKSIP